MYFPEKTEILKGRGCSRLWNGGVTHFGISEGKGGLKHGSRPWLGMDIFWNCPITIIIIIIINIIIITITIINKWSVAKKLNFNRENSNIQEFLP